MLRVRAVRLAMIVYFLVSMVSSSAWAKEPSAELKNLRAISADFYQAGAYTEALMFAQQALAKTIEEFGAESQEAAIWTYSLGFVADKAGRNDVAIESYLSSVKTREKVYGPDSASTAQALEKLGAAYLRDGQLGPARTAFLRVLKIRNDILPGQSHPFSATALAHVASVDLAEGKVQPALARFRQAVTLLGKEDLTVLAKEYQRQVVARKRFAFVGLARAAMMATSQSGADRTALFAEGFQAAQLAWRTSAAAAIAKMSARLGAGDTPLARDVRTVDDIARRLETLNDQDMKLLADWSKTTNANPEYVAARDAMTKLSLERQRGAQPYFKRQMQLTQEITKLNKTCPPGQKKPGCEGSLEKLNALAKELSELARKSQAAQGNPQAIVAASKRLQAAEAALPGYAVFKATRDRLLTEKFAFEQQLRELRKVVAGRYPAYKALVDPQPLSPRRVQEILGGSEALVLLLSGEKRSYVWAITRDQVAWSEIKATAADIAADVAELRKALDPLAAQKSGVATPFDLNRAHKLYKLVFGGVESALTGKTHLVFIPTGPMTSLPPQVLVTRPPAAGLTSERALREAAWLIRRTALSILPSVQSLEALRRLAPQSGASRAFIGIGDPALVGPNALPKPARGKPSNAVVASRGATNASFYRGNLANVRAVRALTPLPDTAQELQAIARVLGAGPDDVLLRNEARESIIKSRPLKSYRVVHFATHGLVSGELSGLAEPALVLTPPEQPTAEDDGLLTASEIVTLSLDADWVVLSACNTAAGDDIGAEALSGLARAFFFAGARALLVSHWSVFSDAAVKLTTTAFGALRRSQERGKPIGRAEALRQSMLALVDDGRPPAYWAPFVVVGDGGR
ncbi:MAG: CHAT domain-containing tetratricopeptide repeat protein [Pseudomonadota bacterium]